jgi:hypothetical protein
MGGSSKGGGARPETQATIYPSPTVSPVQQPNPGAQTQYGQYYLPQNVEALRQQLMTQGGSMPFGVRSPFRQIAPDSPYAAPRAPQVFRPSSVPSVPMTNPVQASYAERLAELEARLAASNNGNGYFNDGGGNG